jgi:hypothetical protein
LGHANIMLGFWRTNYLASSAVAKKRFVTLTP